MSKTTIVKTTKRKAKEVIPPETRVAVKEQVETTEVKEEVKEDVKEIPEPKPPTETKKVRETSEKNISEKASLEWRDIYESR